MNCLSPLEPATGGRSGISARRTARGRARAEVAKTGKASRWMLHTGESKEQLLNRKRTKSASKRVDGLSPFRRDPGGNSEGSGGLMTKVSNVSSVIDCHINK